MRIQLLIRIIFITVLSTVISGTALAQYGGGGGTTSSTYSTPSGGYSSGKAIGIGVGVAVAVVAIALIVHHRHVVASSHGSSMGPTQGTQSNFSLPAARERQVSQSNDTRRDPSIDGRVEPTGQMTQGDARDLATLRKDLIKEYGTLKAPSALIDSSIAR